MSFQSLIRQPTPLHKIKTLEAYFDGEHRLDALGVTLPPQLRILELVLSWPRMTVEALVERLTLYGFSLAGDTTIDQRSWQWWQSNNLDTNSTLLHTEALVQGLGYAIVGPGENGDIPRISVHSQLGIAVHLDPTTGRVREAVRRYQAADGSTHAMFYEPGRRTDFEHTNGGWAFRETVDSGTPLIPVIPFTNRARIGDRLGRSEMHDVMALTDACSRTLTNLQVAQELVALPQRYLIGGKGNLGASITDPNGKPVSIWDTYIGRILTAPEGATIGQLPGADLNPIINTVKLYAQQVAAATGMPNSYLGITTDNPESAAALNAAANRHVKKAENKQVLFGESWEEVIRVAASFVDGSTTDNNARLESRWRDAATPTIGEASQAVIGLFNAGIIPAAVARDMLPLTPEQKALAAVADDADPMNRLVKSVGA